MKVRAPLGWVGIDVGKGHHWVCLIDEAGTTVWSKKVVNDEAEILEAIGGVLAHAGEVVWGVDVTGTTIATTDASNGLTMSLRIHR